MTLLEILKLLAAVATIITGLVSLVAPRGVRGFTGLQVDNPRGITEIRAVLGGGFIGLGLAPLILGASAGTAYQVLGITYAAIGVTRLIGMVLDRSVVQSNIISIAVEVVFVVILLL